MQALIDHHPPAQANISTRISRTAGAASLSVLAKRPSSVPCMSPADHDDSMSRI